MATLYSDQVQKAFIDARKGKLEPQEFNGRVRKMLCEISLSAELNIGDIIKFAQIPANATIIDMSYSISASFTAGSIEIGWGAGDEGIEVADPNGFFTVAALTSTTLQEMDKTLAGAEPGYGKKFKEPVDLEGVISVANTTSASGESIRLEVLYVID